MAEDEGNHRVFASDEKEESLHSSSSAQSPPPQLENVFNTNSLILEQDDRFDLKVYQKMGNTILEFDVRKALKDQDAFLEKTQDIIDKYITMDRMAEVVAEGLEESWFLGNMIAKDDIDNTVDIYEGRTYLTPEEQSFLDKIKTHQDSWYGDDQNASYDDMHDVQDGDGPDYQAMYTQFSYDSEIFLTKEDIKSRLANPYDDATGNSTFRTISLDPSKNLSARIRGLLSTTLESTLKNSGLTADKLNQLENTFSIPIKPVLDAFVKYHEQGHTLGKTMGLGEAGSDYYGTVKLLKQYNNTGELNEGVREFVTFWGDLRTLKTMDSLLDSSKEEADQQKAAKYGFGTYLAIDEALKLSPKELANTSEEETLKRAAQFDALVKDRDLVEYDVTRDIRLAVEQISIKAGTEGYHIDMYQQAIQNLRDSGVYGSAEGEDIMEGSETAIKLYTLEKLSQAFDRLEDRIGKVIEKPPSSEANNERSEAPLNEVKTLPTPTPTLTTP